MKPIIGEGDDDACMYYYGPLQFYMALAVVIVVYSHAKTIMFLRYRLATTEPTGKTSYEIN